VHGVHVHGEHGVHELDPGRGPEQVTDHRLRRADRQLVRVRAEDEWR
jgi:hypothetical protein